MSKEINKFISKEGYLELPDKLFKELSLDEANEIKSLRKPDIFKLPDWEIEFFEWLKKEDPEVWDDLWKDDNITQRAYYVSTIFLPLIVDDNDRGFPICDLENTDNYYFTPKHVVDEESKVMIEVANRKFKKRERLTHTELLAFEISLGAIDIWHLAYKYKLKLTECKKAVKKLVEDGALVHLKESEHLVPFIEF